MGLQFDHAEFDGGAAPPLACSRCSTPIADVYFQADEDVVCGRCRLALQLAQRAAPGGGLGRLIKAVVAGGAAAGLGAGLWYLVRWITGGWEFGLIAIVVGVMVGAAVRWGSEGRGGRTYQLLAVFLTYNAIVVTYIPSIIEAFKEAPQQSEEAVTSGAADDDALPAEERATDGAQATGESVAAEDLELASDVEGAAAEVPAGAGQAEEMEMNPLLGVLGLVLLLVVAYVAPFLALMGDISAVLWLIIIGIGLWEAWKMNRRREISITGPFRVGAAAESVEQP